MVQRRKPVKKMLKSESLAVTYRPKVLDDLVYQDKVISVLKGMFKKKRLPGAFLIDGHTGTGKTTTARLIHRYVNCDTMNACGKCDSCITPAKEHNDFTNVSAGVNGKIDDIRKLIQSSNVAPFQNKRIITIDEAHNLTGASAEALLVPIEEPSSDTLWILCTTNPEKLKGTLLTRCTRLTMKPIPVLDIAKHMSYISKREGVDIASSREGKNSLKTIANFSNGSMREAISILEMVIYASSGGADITDKDVIAEYISNSEVDLDKAAVSLIASLLNNDLTKAIKFVRVSSSARGLISKSRWLLDYIIGSKTGSAKFTPYSGRLFNNIVKDKDIQVKLDKLLLLQLALVNTEMKMNTCSIDENVLLQTAIADYAFNS